MGMRVGYPVLVLTALLASCSTDSAELNSVGNGGSGRTSLAASGRGTGDVSNTVGGESSNGGRPGGTGGSPSSGGAASSSNSTCAPWPREKLFPLVGVFYFGPDPGPCSATTYAGNTEYSYDASGKLDKSTSSTNSVSTQYTYQQGQLVTITDVASDGTTTTSYEYGSVSVQATSTGPSGSKYGFEYSLDALGYPVSIVPIADAATTNPIGRYVYEYEDCRIARRVAYAKDGSVNQRLTAQYRYDAEQHLLGIKTQDSEDTFDYSCW